MCYQCFQSDKRRCALISLFFAFIVTSGLIFLPAFTGVYRYSTLDVNTCVVDTVNVTRTLCIRDKIYASPCDQWNITLVYTNGKTCALSYPCFTDDPGCNDAYRSMAVVGAQTPCTPVNGPCGWVPELERYRYNFIIATTFVSFMFLMVVAEVTLMCLISKSLYENSDFV